MRPQKFFFDLARDDFVLCWKNFHLRLSFHYMKNATGSYFRGERVRKLIPSGHIVSLSKHKFRGCSEKVFERINQTRNVCLWYKLLPCSRKWDNFSMGFDRITNDSLHELRDNMKHILKFLVGLSLEGVFRFTEQQIAS